MGLRGINFVSSQGWCLDRPIKSNLRQLRRLSSQPVVAVTQKQPTRTARLLNHNERIQPAAELAQQLAKNDKILAEDSKLLGTYSDSRAALFARVLSNRTRHITFVLDGVHGAHNLAAIARSCDAWGIQDLHLIAQPEEYKTKLAIDRPAKYKSIVERFDKEHSVRNVSKNAHKWLTIREYEDVPTCVSILREAGYKIAVSSLSPSALPVQDVDISEKCAFVFGNEKFGVTSEMEKNADILFTIPMMGFVESMNVSVAVATTAGLTVTNCKQTIPKEKYDLNENETKQLANVWLTEKYKSRGNQKPLPSAQDVTRLGPVQEKNVIKFGMFAIPEDDSVKPDDYWRNAFRLNGKGGVQLAMYLSRRKFGSLGDRKFSKRCESLQYVLAGAHSLSCEAALQSTQGEVILRKQLLPYFRKLCDNVNSVYNGYFDDHGSPLLPLHAPESHAEFQNLQDAAQKCVLPMCVKIAAEWMKLSEEEVYKIILQSDHRSISRLITSTVRLSPQKSSEFYQVVESSSHVLPEVVRLIQERDCNRKIRSATNYNLQTGVDTSDIEVNKNDIQLLHIFIRLAQCGFLCSELHQTAWERESSGRNSNRLVTFQYALIESILMESYAEMMMLECSQEKAFLRLVFEMTEILEDLKDAVIAKQTEI